MTSKRTTHTRWNCFNRAACFIVFLSVVLLHSKSSIHFTNATNTEERSRSRRQNSHTMHTLDSKKAHVDLQNLDLEENDADAAAQLVVEKINQGVKSRLTELFQKAKTNECRAMIGEHFAKFINAIGTETSLPFSDIYIHNECDEQKYDFDDLPEGVGIGDIQGRTYQPPRTEETYIDDPMQLNLCYAIMTHDKPDATIRLIEALHEEGHVFIIHVDGKETSDSTQVALEKYAASHPYVHVLPNSWRIRVNWGGYSMVEAALQTLKYAFAIDRPLDPPLRFHKFVQMASSTYPIASNTKIRNQLASYPLNANFMDVVFKPVSPGNHDWHYFIECDDAVHRIYRLPALRENIFGGIDMYTASQWFIISREFAKYLAMSPSRSLVKNFSEYAKHVVVADETFFGTVLRQTRFCYHHHNDNFLHVQFDRWENEISDEQRDERKCLMPNDDHCGRSPTTMTVDYLPMLEISNDLFARKFHDEVDPHIKDIIDIKRAKEEANFEKKRNGEPETERDGVDLSFEGQGVLIVAKETIHDDMPLCLGLGDARNKVRLYPCFYDDVIETLVPGWDTGAVILDETLLHNRWEIGPCSTDGNVERLHNGTMSVTSGLYSQTGPQCMFTQMDGLRTGRCMDGESDRTQPGGEVQVFPCRKRWHQTFSFGNGELAPLGSIHMNVPLHVQNRIKSKGKDQEPHMCLGVLGRGDKDEVDWDAEVTTNMDEDEISISSKDGARAPLSEWEGEQVVTTRCSNTEGIIEWIFVPFIHEDEVEEYVTDDAEMHKMEPDEVETNLDTEIDSSQVEL